MFVTINLTLKGGIIMAFGLVCFTLGLKDVMRPYGRMMASGLVLLGLGIIAFGATNGFSDWSPFGRRLFQGGVAALLLGLLMIGNSYFRFF